MRRNGWIGGGLLAGVALGAFAQMHKVARPETVVRAVGVYEWTGDLAKPKGQRFVPVTIFIDGSLQDAGVYMARPVPMALMPGNLYELDDAGVEKGLVDVKEARHLQIPAAADVMPYDNTWLGYGSFEAPKAPKPLAPKKAGQQVAVNGKAGAADEDSDRPKFSSRGAQPGSGGSAKSGSGSPEDVKIDDDPSDKKDAKDDVDRPTLRRRPPADPKQAKADKKKKEESSVTGEKQSLNDDPDRPRMKRTHETDEDSLAPLNGLPADMHQMVGVSDPKRREPHPFARAWEDETEHQAILKQMREMAKAQLVAYGPVPPELLVAAAPAPVAGAGGSAPPAGPALKSQDTSTGAPPVLRRNHVAADAAAKEQVVAPVVAAPVAPAKAVPGKTAAAKTAVVPKTAAARRAAAAKAKKAAETPDPQYALVDEELKGYTLSYGGAPTYVYTAHTAGTGAALRYVTVVAQSDGLNGLKMAMHTVTDAAHLDRQAWMRFVDVVDVEASNRASLLFEMRGQTSRQFALFRVIGGKSDAVFTGGTTQ